MIKLLLVILSIAATFCGFETIKNTEAVETKNPPIHSGQNSSYLHLMEYTFDPLKGTPNGVDFITETELKIIQFEGPITKEQTSLLLHNGYEILDYIPNNAYLIKPGLYPKSKEQIYGIRWVGNYPNQLKLSKTLRRLLKNSNTSQEEIVLDFSSYEGIRFREIEALLGHYSVIYTQTEGKISGVVFVDFNKLQGLVNILLESNLIKWVSDREYPIGPTARPNQSTNQI